MQRSPYCLFEWENNKLLFSLPITLPTSKIRIKRRHIDEFGYERYESIAPRQVELSDKDFIEWQISYIYDNELVEFGAMINEFYQKNILTEKEILKVLMDIKNEPTFEEIFYIKRKSINYKKIKDFEILIEESPILRLNFNDGCFVDISLKHRQRAVGYQAMVYLYIPLKNKNIISSKPIIGRKADRGEIIKWYPEKEHVIGLLKSFLIASRTHRQDIIHKVLPKILVV